MLFDYKALDANGQYIDGSYEADDRDALMVMFRENGLMPVKIDEAIDNSITIKGRKKKVGTKELAIFARQFATMLEAGIGMVRCLDILQAQTANRTLAEACGEMSQSVQKGNLLSKAMENYPKIFPPLMVQLVVSGESSGNLDVIMGRIATTYEKDSKTENKIKGAMTYPMVLGVVLVLVILIMVMFVLPQFIGMLTQGGGEIPMSTKILLAMTNFTQEYWYIVLGVLVGLVVGANVYFSTPAGKFTKDNLLIRIPYVGTQIKMIITSRFTRTLATLLSSGIQMLESLRIVSRVVNNVAVEERLLQAMEDVRKGATLSKALYDVDIFPPMMISMVKVGEESGDIDSVLNKTADFYDEEVDSAIQRLVGILEPAMIVVMGAVVGFFVMAIMSSMYAMYDTF